MSEYLCLNVFVSCLVLSGSHYYEEDMIFGQLSCFIAAILHRRGHFRHLEVFNSNTDGICKIKLNPLHHRPPRKRQGQSMAAMYNVIRNLVGIKVWIS